MLGVPVAWKLRGTLVFGGMRQLPDIRQAIPADIPVLLDLRERMWVELGSDDAARLDEISERSRSWLEEAFAEGRAVGWVAERDGSIVAGLTMTLMQMLPQYRSPNGQVAYILGLFVVPSERGAGLATRLVDGAVAHARQRGADVVVLHAADKARPLYERRGFKATKEMRLQFSEYDSENPGGGCCV